MMTLNHGFSGYFCGRVVLPLIARRSPLGAGWLATACFIGAMLPDSDALGNLWGAEVYFSPIWYGHRNASHSILGTLILALAVGCLLALVARWRSGIGWAAGYRWLVPALWAGGLLHVLGDLGTPGMPMPLLWPLAGDYGSLRHIGWFSPALLWLFVGGLLAEAAIHLGAGLVRRSLVRRAVGGQPRPGGMPAPAAVLLWMLHLAVACTWLAYLNCSRYESPAQWWAYQRMLVPEVLLVPVTEAVSGAWHWMVR